MWSDPDEQWKSEYESLWMKVMLQHMALWRLQQAFGPPADDIPAYDPDEFDPDDEDDVLMELFGDDRLDDLKLVSIGLEKEMLYIMENQTSHLYCD